VKITSPYAYPKLERTTLADGNRFYLCPETGQPLPSVTTIISNTADKSGLNEWIKRVGTEQAELIRDQSAAMGTIMHTHLENYIQEIPRPGGTNLIYKMAKKMADNIIENGLSKVDEVWGIETPLYFPGAYAGTCDLVGTYKGKPAIMDYKNARSKRKLTDESMVVDYMAQLCAYATAHNVMFGTNIECGVIFMSSREYEYAEYVIEGDKFKHYQHDFLTRLEKYLAANPV
jgi:genome maintenance exonuclease 1